jgi:hypothetical protein
VTPEEAAERIVALERRMLALEVHLSLQSGTVFGARGDSDPMTMGPDQANTPRDEA